MYQETQDENMSEYDYEYLESELSSVLAEINLCPEDFIYIKNYIEHGEYGIALETIFFILLEKSVPLSRELKNKIHDLTIKMGMADTIDISNLK